jgi:hypothetical protein
VSDLGSNKWWLFWTVLVTLFGILIYSLTGFPKSFIGKTEKTSLARPLAISSSDLNNINKMLDSNKEMPTEAEKLIAFTKKTVCRRNVEIINTMVEFWSVKHDGLWPRDDLSDIGRDKNYFPKGVPACPIDGSPYRLDPVSHRVKGHEHPGIQFDLKEMNVMDAELEKTQNNRNSN